MGGIGKGGRKDTKTESDQLRTSGSGSERRDDLERDYRGRERPEEKRLFGPGNFQKTSVLPRPKGRTVKERPVSTSLTLIRSVFRDTLPYSTYSFPSCRSHRPCITRFSLPLPIHTSQTSKTSPSRNPRCPFSLLS